MPKTLNPSRSGGSGKEKKKAVQKPAPGREFMLFRVWSAILCCFSTCNGTTAGHVADAAVHRYHRIVGYANKEQAELDRDPKAAAAQEELRAGGAAGQERHQQQVFFQSLFERFVQAYHPTSAYCAFLRSSTAKAVKPTGKVTRLPFQRPPHYLITSWAMHLRKVTLTLT
jgi:hypothetical protein